MYDLSILLPSIRPHNLVSVYDSILEHCTKYTFELIIVGPLSPPAELYFKPNIKYIKSFRSPNACQQIAACAAEGQYLTSHSDDAWFVYNSINLCLDWLNNKKNSKSKCVTIKYSEGGDDIHGDDYYKLNLAYPSSKWVKDDWYIFNGLFIERVTFEKYGGFDCIYSVPALGHADLAIRYQLENGPVELFDTPVYKCDWEQKDHLPIEFTHKMVDEPLYKEKWNKDELPPLRVSMDNWKNSPILFEKRFIKEESVPMRSFKK